NSGSVPGTAPSLQAHYPSSGQNNVVLNPLIELAFDQVLKASSINSDNIQLRKEYSGAIHPLSLSVSEDGTRVLLKLLSPLEKNAIYYVRLFRNIEDQAGDKYRYENYTYFYTGAESQEATQSPFVLMTSPADGTENVPVN